MPLQYPVHPLALPVAQPEGDLGSVHLKGAGNLGRRFPFHIEDDGMEPRGHTVSPLSKGPLTEVNQSLDRSCRATDCNRSHGTLLWIPCYIMSL